MPASRSHSNSERPSPFTEGTPLMTCASPGAAGGSASARLASPEDGWTHSAGGRGRSPGPRGWPPPRSVLVSDGWSRSSVPPSRCLARDVPIPLDRLVERLPGLGALLGGDLLPAGAPELLEGAEAPKRAPPRGTDRPAADPDRDRVGVQLRELAHGHPATPLDRQPEG